jgi:F-type H+-transporting ATPase subunit gamma
MASLRDIRNRIGSVKNTQQVTRAMKMVAAAKLRKAQERIFQTRPYAYKLGEIISHLKGQFDPSANPLFLEREVINNVLLIVITADRGLAGAFNSNVIKTAEQTIQDHYADLHANGKVHILAIGRKGHEHFARRGYPMVSDFRGAFKDLRFSTAHEAGDRAVEGFAEGEWDAVMLIYNEFKNTISQNRIAEPLLPLPSEQFLTPVMEQDIEVQAQLKEGQAIDYIFEPDAETILKELVPRYLNYELWRAMLESNAAEQGARMVAMDNATTNADELLRALRLQYNRARQSAITTEILEIISGANALEESG